MKAWAPTEENILEKPTEINQAKPSPTTEPRPLETNAKTAPSYTNRERASLFLRPSALTVANSVRRTSARSMMMVNDSNAPAAMVKVPNTRNMAESAPEEASACSAASSCTARTVKCTSLRSLRWSNQAWSATMEEVFSPPNPPPENMSRERSSSPASARRSPSERETSPSTTESRSASCSNPSTDEYSPPWVSATAESLP